MFVEAVFCIFPPVRMIGSLLLDDRERETVESVVAMGHDRKTYAESILDVCEIYTRAPMRCAAGISGSDLKKRITGIMRSQSAQKLNSAKRLLLTAAATLCLLVPLLAGLIGQQDAAAQDVADETPGNQSVFPDSPPPSRADGPILPVTRPAPIYPPEAARSLIEGYVIVEYAINESGETENVFVVDSSSAIFERAAVESAQKYKYLPVIEDGQAVRKIGVRTKIEFVLVSPTDAAQ
jgi:TonB family protein